MWCIRFNLIKQRHILVISLSLQQGWHRATDRRPICHEYALLPDLPSCHSGPQRKLRLPCQRACPRPVRLCQRQHHCARLELPTHMHTHQTKTNWCLTDYYFVSLTEGKTAYYVNFFRVKVREVLLLKEMETSSIYFCSKCEINLWHGADAPSDILKNKASHQGGTATLYLDFWE